MNVKNRYFLLLVVILILSSVGYSYFLKSKRVSLEQRSNRKVSFKQTAMKLKSPAFENYGDIPSKYTCDGNNVNPPLSISEVPEEAESLVLIVDDPDAPMGTWVHWTVWNIDPQTKEIQENSLPEGAVEGMTDFGTSGYGGPCPPSGKHRYFFKLYALDTKLQLPPETTKEKLERAMEGHILVQTELIGLYSRESGL